MLNHYTTIGDDKKLELVKKVSPIAWVNVNLNGKYSFSPEQNMINLADVLRPLAEAVLNAHSSSSGHGVKSLSSSQLVRGFGNDG